MGKTVEYDDVSLFLFSEINFWNQSFHVLCIFLTYTNQSTLASHYLSQAYWFLSLRVFWQGVKQFNFYFIFYFLFRLVILFSFFKVWQKYNHRFGKLIFKLVIFNFRTLFSLSEIHNKFFFEIHNNYIHSATMRLDHMHMMHQCII